MSAQVHLVGRNIFLVKKIPRCFFCWKWSVMAPQLVAITVKWVKLSGLSSIYNQLVPCFSWNHVDILGRSQTTIAMFWTTWVMRPHWHQHIMNIMTEITFICYCSFSHYIYAFQFRRKILQLIHFHKPILTFILWNPR